MHAVVAAQDATSGIDDLATPAARLGTNRLDDGCVVAIGDEADLLALRLVGRRQAQRAGARADLRFAQLTEREPGLLELALVENIQRKDLDALAEELASGVRIQISRWVFPL